MAPPRLILGVSAYHHDSAAALLRDGRIVCAAREERFTRRKNDPEFPVNAIRFCLRHAGLCAQELALIFIVIITPLGWLLRLAGQDPLQLKRPADSASYRNRSSDATPLEHLF